MARKTITITLDDRGTSLTFRIREMAATKLESFIARAVLLLAASGITLPDGADMRAAGQYLSQNGLTTLTSLDYEAVRPLLDDLLACCHRVLPEGPEVQLTPATVDGVIEDVRTLFALRLEALKLNLDFFDIGVLAPSLPAQGAAKATPTT